VFLNMVALAHRSCPHVTRCDGRCLCPPLAICEYDRLSLLEAIVSQPGIGLLSKSPYFSALASFLGIRVSAWGRFLLASHLHALFVFHPVAVHRLSLYIS
jgi:hypothetical protein